MILSGSLVQRKGRGSSLVSRRKRIDGGLKLDDGAEHTTFEPPLGELGKETLDRVEPRGGRWCEMECPAWMPRQPGPDLGMLVRCIVVGDGVDQFGRRDTGLDGVEEPNELLMPVALHAAPDHPAVQHIEGANRVVVPWRL